MIATPSNLFTTVAIDGGAASGKSSTARRIAEDFGLLHVDTGSHYRAITARLLEAGVSPEDPAAIQDGLAEIDFSTEVVGQFAQLVINHQTVPDDALRTDQVNAGVSLFAASPAVRNALKTYQRSLVELARAANFPGLVMEGRDIGSVILPDADLAFFLEADPVTRAQRRAEQGQTDEVQERDRLDASRKHAPLVCPPRAERIDTGTLNLDQVAALIAERLEARGHHARTGEPNPCPPTG